MVNIIISSDKKLSLVNKSRIYYGEDKIGNINVKVEPFIGEYNCDELEFTLYIIVEDKYFQYNLELDENGECSIPITTDLTDTIGTKKLFVVITRGETVIGKTNTKTITVEKSESLNQEIEKRDELIARVEALETDNAEKSSTIENVKEALIHKNSGVTEDTPASEYADFILEFPTNDDFKKIIDGSITELIVPAGITRIKDDLCRNDYDLTLLVLPDSVTEIGEYAFANTGIHDVTLPENLERIWMGAFQSTKIEYITIPARVNHISSYAFSYCGKLKELIIPSGVKTVSENLCYCCSSLERLVIEHGITKISSTAFYACHKLTDVYIPNTITENSSSAFLSSNNLENVTLENGFNANQLDFSYSTKFTSTTIVSWFNALADRTGLSSYFIIIGNINLAKLTAEEKAIATNKNWNLA